MEDRIAAAAPALLSKIVVDVDMGKDEGEGEENDAIEDGHDAIEDEQDADDDVMDNGEDARLLQEQKIAPAGDDQSNEEVPVGVRSTREIKACIKINAGSAAEGFPHGPFQYLDDLQSAVYEWAEQNGRKLVVCSKERQTKLRGTREKVTCERMHKPRALQRR
jgi:hypothetical protein